jgi:hypothetical protein
VAGLARLAFAVSGAKREAKRQHIASVLPTAREQATRAGRDAERWVADELAEVLNDEWLLLRGYRGELVYQVERLEDEADRGLTRGDVQVHVIDGTDQRVAAAICFAQRSCAEQRSFTAFASV